MSYVDVLNRISQLQSQLAALDGVPASTTATTGSPADEHRHEHGRELRHPARAGADREPRRVRACPGPLRPTTTAGAVTASPQAGGVAPAASPLLTSSQQQFAARLGADTGLDPGVVDAWVLAEESSGAATARQSANNNDWLNIGYTDSATYGASDSVWGDPVTAADATAGWLSGKNTIPGTERRAAECRRSCRRLVRRRRAQISAIQSSGWASSGYPDLPALYQQIVA